MINQEDVKKAEKALKEGIKQFTSLQKEIVDQYIKGKSLIDIGKKKDISKQYIAQVLDKALKELNKVSEIHNLCKEIFKEDYVDVSKIFKTHYRVIERLGKLHFKKQQHFGITTEKTKKVTAPNTFLRKSSIEKGFPIQLKYEGYNKAFLNEAAFYYEGSDKEYWGIKDENQIIANKKLLFLKNLCLWQTKNKSKSLWEVFMIFYQAIPNYLEEQEITELRLLNRVIYSRRNSIGKTPYCKIIMIGHLLEDHTPIYEIENYKIKDPIKYIDRILKIKRGL